VSTRASIRANIAHLRLSNDDTLAAVTQIEALAASHPKLAGELAAEVLRSMARAWDMIQNLSRQSSYMQSQLGYMIAVQNQPLTRITPDPFYCAPKKITTRVIDWNLPVRGSHRSDIILSGKINQTPLYPVSAIRNQLCGRASAISLRRHRCGFAPPCYFVD